EADVPAGVRNDGAVLAGRLDLQREGVGVPLAAESALGPLDSVSVPIADFVADGPPARVGFVCLAVEDGPDVGHGRSFPGPTARLRLLGCRSGRSCGPLPARR